MAENRRLTRRSYVVSFAGMGRHGRVRVLVADDHPLYRDGITRAIKQRPDLELVGECSDGREALARVQELAPEVAVLDVSMPSVGGIEVVTALTDRGSSTRALILTAFTDAALVYDAIAAGARGYLLKDVDRRTICDAIARVSRGGTVFSTELHEGIAQQIRARRDDSRPRLSPREHEILSLLADGRSGPEIARLLFLSPSTVKTHLSNIYEKLEVSDRAAAVAKALREGVMQ
jgi:two-component system nitrate/nitrite response regulator NarL